MKLNCIKTPARVINRFGNAWLIRLANGKHELVGGNDSDYTAAKEWVSLFAHDVYFSRSMKREPQPRFCFGSGLG